MSHLKDDLDLPGWYRDGASLSELRRRLQVRAAMDYSREEWVEVGGCCLSVTELRLCALITFS